MPRSSQYTQRAKSPESHAKSEVISKFLVTWAQILGRGGSQLNYAELYAGNGYHDETGEKGTALECIDAICRTEPLHGRIGMILNEGDRASAQNLRSAIDGYARNKCLREWSVESQPVSVSQYRQFLESASKSPTFWFLDPTGWGGLSLEGIIGLTEPRYNDLVFFLSYENINRFLKHQGIQDSLRNALGSTTLEIVHAEIDECSTARAREELVVSTLRETYMDHGRFSECMRFGHTEKANVSHYLIFVTKHPRGRRAFMSIVQKVSNWQPFGVQIPGFASHASVNQLSLFSNSGLEEEIEDQIWNRFSGETLEVDEAIDLFFSPKFSLTERSMKTILGGMEGKGKLSVDTPADKRKRDNEGRPTLGGKRVLTFKLKELMDGK